MSTEDLVSTVKPEASSGDPLTTVIVGLLALIAGAGTVFCIVYAIWWLAKYWAPL
jgi:hypothetical protein